MSRNRIMFSMDLEDDQRRCNHETNGDIFIEGSDWQQCSLCGEQYCLDDEFVDLFLEG